MNLPSGIPYLHQEGGTEEETQAPLFRGDTEKLVGSVLSNYEQKQ